jgi:hypothetical protein
MLMRARFALLGLAAAALLSGSAFAQSTHNDLVNNPATRAFDRAAGTDTSGAYPAQADGTPANPQGTMATRAFDRAAGTDVSGTYPSQANGTPENPPGTKASRAFDRAAGTNVSGAYPANSANTH